MARSFEDYVSQDQAFYLKELGFDWDCNHWYHPEEKHMMYNSDYCNHNKSKTGVSAPTLAQARKWLEEKYFYYIIIDVTNHLNDDGTWTVRYPYKIRDSKLELVTSEAGWMTYDSSLEEAITDILCIIRNQ